ncbi:hypothetical protein [Paenibacillus rhizolycopersici]|uniref:hypothetical protein n=1 Tax=Paenibacillus rhizolycopersici TaxID=2780073 RepID=UPI003D2C6697
MSQPQENGNANQISLICSAIHPALFVRYEALAEFLSDEPQFIHIKVDQNQDSILMDQVLRVRIWSNTGLTSWQIFSENRVLNEGGESIPIVIRKLIWKKDNKILENMKKEDRKSLLQSWPEIDIMNQYLELPPDANLFRSIDNLDLRIEKGVQLTSRNNDFPSWINIEIMRLYEWGKMNIIWSQEKQHQELEERIKELIEEFSSVFEMPQISEMVLDYSIQPEEFRKIVTGTR